MGGTSSKGPKHRITPPGLESESEGRVLHGLSLSQDDSLSSVGALSAYRVKGLEGLSTGRRQ